MLVETEKLIIRLPNLEDVDGMEQLHKDPIAIKFNCFKPKSKEDIIKEIEEQKPDRYAIILKNSKQFIGEINISEDWLRFNKNARTLSYNLLAKFRGQGLMKEALLAVLKYCFTEMQLGIVSVRVFSTNARSKEMVLRAGFKHEGTLRRAVYCSQTDILHDDCLFSMTKQEYLDLYS